jgi:hypothetical protein
MLNASGPQAGQHGDSRAVMSVRRVDSVLRADPQAPQAHAEMVPAAGSQSQARASQNTVVSAVAPIRQGGFCGVEESHSLSQASTSFSPDAACACGYVLTVVHELCAILKPEFARVIVARGTSASGLENRPRALRIREFTKSFAPHNGGSARRSSPERAPQLSTGRSGSGQTDPCAAPGAPPTPSRDSRGLAEHARP